MTSLASSALDASDMLAAALEQMDGIIAGFDSSPNGSAVKLEMNNSLNSSRSETPCNGVRSYSGAAALRATATGAPFGTSPTSNTNYRATCQQGGGTTVTNAAQPSIEQLLDDLRSVTRQLADKLPLLADGNDNVITQHCIDPDTRAFILQWLQQDGKTQDAVDDDDDDSDLEDDDEEMEEEEEDDSDISDDEHPSQEDVTPTNEMTASDEFEWIRNSPILTSLLQQEQLRSASTVAPPAEAPLPPPIAARHFETKPPKRSSRPLTAATSAATAPEDPSRHHDDKSSRKSGVRRREDYPVIGGENFTAPAAVTAGVAGSSPGRRPAQLSVFSGSRRCPCHDCLALGTSHASLTPPPPPRPSSASSCHPGCDGRCRRTSQPYLSDPSPVASHLSDGSCRTRRPRARSQPRIHARRRHDVDPRMQVETGLPAPLPPPFAAYAFGCPFGHGRNLALEYVQWMSFFKANGLPLDYDDLQEKVHRLEGDKESLTMQVSVLGEQIDAQTDKIRDLESLLENKKSQLNNVEDMLQHGLMTLESQKLDLMSEISNLKLRLTSIEKEKLEMEDRARKAELDGIGLRTQLTEKDREISATRSRAPGRYLLGESADTTKSGFQISPDNSLRRVQQRYLEMEKLRKALECVMAANDEKDRKIDELQGAITRYKNVQDRVLSPHFRKSNSYTTEDEDGNDGSPPKTPEGSAQTQKTMTSTTRINDKPPVGPRPFATSTPLHMKNEGLASTGTANVGSTKILKSSPQAASSEEIAAVPPKTPPVQLRHLVDHYGTIPRKHGPNVGTQDSYRSINHSDLDQYRMRSSRPSGLSFGPGEVPNSGTDPTMTTPRNTQMVTGTVAVQDLKQKPKGIKKIFGRLKRSNSQHLEEPVGEFRRGGIRSTAGPRLGWSTEVKANKERLEAPFALWDGEKIATWLHDMGLTAYIGDCKRWVKNGNQLLNATTQDLEKELGIKNSMHRKKLQLALQAVNSAGDEVIGSLDYNWVTRWLDDVGLPQYKDAFCDARVDGRVLNLLTVEDLFLLKVTNMLHYISLKRGIQVLRLNKFNPNCLKRRPSPEEVGKSVTPEHIALWTNHRVMEWLRSVDLSEYAPNLRGSGVHGAILVFEPKFNVEILASLLSIPANKTLLRRHLNTHFKQLVGPDVVKQKRDSESEGYLPLNPSLRIKANRRSQFTLMRKKNKHDIDYEDYVCPLDTSFNGDTNGECPVQLQQKDPSPARSLSRHYDAAL